MYILTKEKLLADLYKAFYDCRKHKSKKSYVKEFEKKLEACKDKEEVKKYIKYYNIFYVVIQFFIN